VDEQWRVNSWLPLITPHTERYRSLCGVGVDASSFSFRGHHGHGKIKRGIVWISRKGVHLRPIGCVRLEQLHLKSSLSASAYIRPACATNPRQYVSALPIKATGFVERYCSRKVGASGTAGLAVSAIMCFPSASTGVRTALFIGKLPFASRPQPAIPALGWEASESVIVASCFKR